ncbi:MAG: type II secretion system F family protein [Armatimonadota bacterium]|jgi:tight adherence protein C
MNTLIIIITVLVFADVLLVVSTLMSEGGKMRITRRRQDLRSERRTSSVAMLLAIPFAERLLKPAVRRTAASIGGRAPASILADTEVQLDRAGRPMGFSAEGFITFRLISAAVGFIGAYILAIGPLAVSPYRLPVAGFVALVGLLIPLYVVQKGIERRHAEIRKTLPDVIDLLVVSVEAGAGLDGALAEVVDRKDGALVDEFTRLLGEMRVGRSRRQAWENMSKRVDEENLSALVASLVQAEEVGVSIGKALRAQAETVRVRRSLQVREMAATLPVKMLFPLILFIFPTLFVVLLGPGLLGITDVLAVLAGE